MKCRLLPGIALLACLTFSLPFATAQNNEALRSQIRDFPPDFHQYIREVIPQDLAPGGAPALQQGGINLAGFPASLFIRDVVVSNTDPNLTNTFHSSQSEPSIAINPVHPQEIEILAFNGGWGTDAPIWHSQTRAASGPKSSLFPILRAFVLLGARVTRHQTLARPTTCLLFSLTWTTPALMPLLGTTLDPTSAAAWEWLLSGGVAQPYRPAGSRQYRPALAAGKSGPGQSLAG